MSGALGKLSLSNPFGRGGLINRTGRAGPRRLALIGSSAIVVLGSIVVASFMGRAEAPQSRATPMPAVNPLPGGPNSNPNQDRLSLQHNQEQAAAATREGRSFTPPLAPSRPLNGPLTSVTPPVAPVVTPPVPQNPASTIHLVTAPAPRLVPPETRSIQQVAQTNQTDPQQDARFQAAVAEVVNGW